MKKLLLIAAAIIATATTASATVTQFTIPGFERRGAHELAGTTNQSDYLSITVASPDRSTVYEINMYLSPNLGWLADETGIANFERDVLGNEFSAQLNRYANLNAIDVLGDASRVVNNIQTISTGGATHTNVRLPLTTPNVRYFYNPAPIVVPLTDAQKLTSIQDLIDAARLNPPDPGIITVQGQRPNNLGMRGVDVNTFAATSNARRPWQRDRVTTMTTINGEQTRYHIQITQNLVPQIDRIARSIAKAYYDKGFDEGYEDGYENGYRDGYRDGYNQALDDVEAKL